MQSRRHVGVVNQWPCAFLPRSHKGICGIRPWTQGTGAGARTNHTLEHENCCRERAAWAGRGRSHVTPTPLAACPHPTPDTYPTPDTWSAAELAPVLHRQFTTNRKQRERGRWRASRSPTRAHAKVVREARTRDARDGRKHKSLGLVVLLVPCAHIPACCMSCRASIKVRCTCGG